MSNEMRTALGRMTDVDVLSSMIDEGEWITAEDDVFLYDYENDSEEW